MSCPHHPLAVIVAGHCGACLIAAALPTPYGVSGESDGGGAGDSAASWPLSVCMPLGSSPHASTYLVRDERLAGSIYRLKRWNTQAPPEFLPRFEDLRRRLAERPVAGALRPVAAYVDGRGHPVVLSPFVQGIPIIEAVAAGTLDVPQALELMRTASAVLRAAHDSDLVHGSITAGNVVAYARTGAVHLLDFGISSLWHANVPDAAGFAEDRHRLAALIRTLRGPRRRGGAQAPL